MPTLAAVPRFVRSVRLQVVSLAACLGVLGLASACSGSKGADVRRHGEPRRRARGSVRAEARSRLDPAVRRHQGDRAPVRLRPGDYEKMLAPPGADDLRYVPCKVTFLGKSSEQAACRRKGDTTDWPLEKKPQMVVKFNLYDPAKRFFGMRHLNLEYFAGTDAPIRDRLGMWLMREAGLDASRVNHARVLKNGAILGLYQNIEAMDHELLEDHFGPDADGNLWKRGSLQDRRDGARGRPEDGPRAVTTRAFARRAHGRRASIRA
jgi:hypothetical protein